MKIANPYFSDPDVMQHLQAAAKRGVDVTVVVPQTNDMQVEQNASRANYADLIAAGVKVYEYHGMPMAHDKVATFDGKMSTIGSSNLDARSLGNNDEANVWTGDPQVARASRQSSARIVHSAWSRYSPLRRNDFRRMPSRKAPIFRSAPLPRTIHPPAPSGGAHGRDRTPRRDARELRRSQPRHGLGGHLGCALGAGERRVQRLFSVDNSGNKVGFDVDLMTEIAKRLAVQVEWVDMPFDSLIAAVQEGKIDASISAFNYSEERDKTIDFSDAYYTSEDAFTVAEKFESTIVNPEDVAAYKVGVQTGTTQDTWLTDTLVKSGKLPEADLLRYDRVDQAMLDLKNGRIDVMMSDYVPAQALAKQLGGLNIVYHGVLSSGPMNIVIPDGDKGLAQAINAIIKQLQSEGFIDQLAQKYIAETK